LAWTKAAALVSGLISCPFHGQALGETGATVALAPTSDAQTGLETAIPAVDAVDAVYGTDQQPSRITDRRPRSTTCSPYLVASAGCSGGIR
jgi:hypothetical protein